HDRDGADADFFERIRLLHQAADDRPHVGAVIANESDQRALRPAHVGERVGLAVHALEPELARLPAEVADVRCGERHGAPPRPFAPSFARRRENMAAAGRPYARPSTIRMSRSAAFPNTLSAA